MRLIDADALIQLCNAPHWCVWMSEIEDFPTIDPESLRPKGRWVLLDECSNAGVYCSVCHKKVYKEQYANQTLKSTYCPNCGAKMEG